MTPAVAVVLAGLHGLVPSSAFDQEQVWMRLPEEKQQAVLDELAELPLRQRLVEVTRRFLGTPYGDSPLGEGEGLDPDPTFRLDQVDCLTFVEEAIALSLSRSVADVAPTLEQLRYFKEPTYADRNHLMEADWLPHNQDKGFLEDVTRRYGGAQVKLLEKNISERAWASLLGRGLRLPKEKQRTGKFALNVLPLGKVREHAHDIPSGTLVVVVRAERPATVTRVSHVAFWVKAAEKVVIRHATSQGARAVVDEDLESFLRRLTKPRAWKVVGLSFFEVHEPELPLEDSQSDSVSNHVR